MATTTMNDDDIRESLSAWVDGELPEARAVRLLESVSADPRLREEWRRHHHASALISGDATLPADDLAERVRAALDAEPVPMAPRPRTVARPGRGLALVAACMAVAAVVVTLGLQDGPDAPEPIRTVEAPKEAIESTVPATVTVAAATATTASPPETTVAQRSDEAVADPAALTRLTWNDARPGVEKRLNGYLLNHHEYLAGGVRGMLPYARIVGYDSRN